MIEEVEHAEADACLQVSVTDGYSDRPQNLQIYRLEPGIAPGISRSDVFTELVLHRVWKSGMDVIDGQDRHFPRGFEFTPEKDAVGRVMRKPATVVGLNDGFGSVSKKLEEIIQIAISTGVHIRRIQHMLSEIIAAIDLEFSVRLLSSIGQRQNA